MDRDSGSSGGASNICQKTAAVAVGERPGGRRMVAGRKEGQFLELGQFLKDSELKYPQKDWDGFISSTLCGTMYKLPKSGAIELAS